MNVDECLKYFHLSLERCNETEDFERGSWLLEHAPRSMDASMRLRVLERCFLASLVIAAKSAAPMRLLGEISKQFPMFVGQHDAVAVQRLIEAAELEFCVERTPIGSFRTLLLHGQLLEARRLFEQAYKLYAFARERSPTNSLLVLRQCCVLKAVRTDQLFALSRADVFCVGHRQMKKTAQCVTLLNSYLAVYTTDVDAWKELALIYIEALDVGQPCRRLVAALTPPLADATVCASKVLHRGDAPSEPAGRQFDAAFGRSAIFAGVDGQRRQGRTFFWRRRRSEPDAEIFFMCVCCRLAQ